MQADLRVKLRLKNGTIGPGKIKLLEAVQETGSISGAARAMDMNYRRAWQLIETLNEATGQTALETTAGGKSGGGAKLTPFAIDLIKLFHDIEQTSRTETASLLQNLEQLISEAKT
jgi:molybdate transport system regulatory protein